MMDDNNHANKLHLQSVKCGRIARSVLAAELYAMALRFDNGLALKASIDNILGQSVQLTIYTDSRPLFDCLVKLRIKQEKRLMIDIMFLRKAYEKQEIAQTCWIDGNSYSADSMVESRFCNALKNLIDLNYVKVDAKKYVERDVQKKK